MSKTLPFPDLAPNHPANQINPALLEQHSTKFAPKLTFRDRCAVAALSLSGISTATLAVAYGINRRTVVAILASDRKAYMDVKRELERLGKTGFIAEYVTEDATSRINKAAGHPDTTVSRGKVPPAGVRAGIPNPRATGHAGINVHRGPGHEYSHRIEIVWTEPDSAPEGWYCKLLDVADMADLPFGDHESGTHLTSQSALKYAKTWLDENV